MVEYKAMKKLTLILATIIILMTSAMAWAIVNQPKRQLESETIVKNPQPAITETPRPILNTPPASKILPNNYHIFQTFNNCGPAALSMALSYYGINVSQQELGNSLRPYQIAGGDNDDKSVTLEELAEKSKEYGFIPYHRPNGNIEILKGFITHDMPIVTRTYLRENEDIGHYRIVKGYDNATLQIIQDDSLQGANLKYSYDEFNVLWEKFNYEYLVLVPKEKQYVAEAILGEDRDALVAWRKAVENSEEDLQENPADIYSRFNLSVALFNIGEYEKSVTEFEKVENSLPFRTLWYQIEPIEAYYELGNYDRVFSITNKVLNYHNRAFSELYFLRGQIYQKQGNLELTRSEFEKAVIYNNGFARKIPQI